MVELVALKIEMAAQKLSVLEEWSAQMCQLLVLVQCVDHVLLALLETESAVQVWNFNANLNVD